MRLFARKSRKRWNIEICINAKFSFLYSRIPLEHIQKRRGCSFASGLRYMQMKWKLYRDLTPVVLIWYGWMGCRSIGYSMGNTILLSDFDKIWICKNYANFHFWNLYNFFIRKNTSAIFRRFVHIAHTRLLRHFLFDFEGTNNSQQEQILLS